MWPGAGLESELSLGWVQCARVWSDVSHRQEREIGWTTPLATQKVSQKVQILFVALRYTNVIVEGVVRVPKNRDLQYNKRIILKKWAPVSHCKEEEFKVWPLPRERESCREVLKQEMSLNSFSSLGIVVWSYDMCITHVGLVKDAHGVAVQCELLIACCAGMVGAHTVLGRSGRTWCGYWCDNIWSACSAEETGACGATRD
jgi:hypothetical protein